jgi:hypothetical protein
MNLNLATESEAKHRAAAVARRHERLAYLVLASLCLAVVAYAWAIDFVSFEGERTIYTVRCTGGTWSGSRCTGTLVLGDRYRFRALRHHKEVLFWTVASTEPAGKLKGCEVVSGRNWSCSINDETSHAVALQMIRGEGALEEHARAAGVRCISKMRWILARLGMPLGHSADPSISSTGG